MSMLVVRAYPRSREGVSPKIPKKEEVDPYKWFRGQPLDLQITPLP